MDDLGIGTLLRTVNAFLERGVKEHDEIGAMSPEERAKYLDVAGARKAMPLGARRSSTSCSISSPRSHNFPRPGGRPGAPVHLLEDLNDKQTDLISEEKRLVENLQFLNAILSGESGIGRPEADLPQLAAGRRGGRKQSGSRYPTMCRSPAAVLRPKREEAEGRSARRDAAGPRPSAIHPYGDADHQVPIMAPSHAAGPAGGIRAIANASGSSLVQLGLGAVKDKIFSHEPRSQRPGRASAR